MKNFNISILGVIGILVLVVFASGCTSSDNNNSNSNSTQNNAPTNEISVSNFTAKLDPYSGSNNYWSYTVTASINQIKILATYK